MSLQLNQGLNGNTVSASFIPGAQDEYNPTNEEKEMEIMFDANGIPVEFIVNNETQGLVHNNQRQPGQEINMDGVDCDDDEHEAERAAQNTDDPEDYANQVDNPKPTSSLTALEKMSEWENADHWATQPTHQNNRDEKEKLAATMHFVQKTELDKYTGELKTTFVATNELKVACLDRLEIAWKQCTSKLDASDIKKAKKLAKGLTKMEDSYRSFSEFHANSLIRNHMCETISQIFKAYIWRLEVTHRINVKLEANSLAGLVKKTVRQAAIFACAAQIAWPEDWEIYAKQYKEQGFKMCMGGHASQLNKRYLDQNNPKHNQAVKDELADLI